MKFHLFVLEAGASCNLVTDVKVWKSGRRE